MWKPNCVEKAKQDRETGPVFSLFPVASLCYTKREASIKVNE